MDWLVDIGKHTRRGLANVAKHTGGLLDHVGAAVDSVATTADNLLPAPGLEVEGHDIPPSTARPIVAAEGRIGRSAENGRGAENSGESLLRQHGQTGGTHTHRPRRQFSGADECEEDKELVVYAQADEGACANSGMEETAHSMSRGLLGLGIHKHPRL